VSGFVCGVGVCVCVVCLFFCVCSVGVCMCVCVWCVCVCVTVIKSQAGDSVKETKLKAIQTVKDAVCVQNSSVTAS